ncbi:MAG: hypothetical protein J0H02_19540 [Armatimonadetes bacterium]|nr:hypothetical protein [Armatimonadota bacterium]
MARTRERKRDENWNRYTCAYVTTSHRAALAGLLNLDLDNPSHREHLRLADYLLFGTSRDRESGQLILSVRHMQDICGRSKRGWRLCVYDQVKEFEALTGAKVTFWHPIDDGYKSIGMARRVESVDWGTNAAEIDQLARAIRRTSVPLDQRVALDTGKKPTRAQLRVMREATQEECLATIAECGNPDAARLLTYLNNLPPHRWSQVAPLVPELRALADHEDNAEHTLSILLKTEATPQPFYRPSPKSARVYAVGSNVLGMHRSVRKALFGYLGWHSFDLKSAQLAILSVTWDVPELREFLESGQSFWSEILGHMGWDDSRKELVKRALYGLAFGAGRDRLIKVFASAEGDDIEKGKALFNHWREHALIRALWLARVRQMKKIRAAGRAHDVYGKEYVVVTQRKDNKHGGDYEENNVRSILACLAQAYEMKLLAPVVEVIENADKRVQLTYWLHDGFGISCPDSLAYILDEIVEKVNFQCKALGVPTSLERE